MLPLSEEAAEKMDEDGGTGADKTEADRDAGAEMRDMWTQTQGAEERKFRGRHCCSGLLHLSQRWWCRAACWSWW